jgi:hypothetical protein
LLARNLAQRSMSSARLSLSSGPNQISFTEKL